MICRRPLNVGSGLIQPYLSVGCEFWSLSLPSSSFTLCESLPLMQGFRLPNHFRYCSSVNLASFHRKKSACALLEEPRTSASYTSPSLKRVSVAGLIPSMPPFAQAGLRWCGGWRRVNFRGSHDQAQNQAEGCDALDRPKDPQARVTQAIGTFIFKDCNPARHQARPHSCDAADASRRYDRRYHNGHGMAAAFGTRLSCRRRSQEARFESCFRIDGQGSGLPNQGQ